MRCRESPCFRLLSFYKRVHIRRRAARDRLAGGWLVILNVNKRSTDVATLSCRTPRRTARSPLPSKNACRTAQSRLTSAERPPEWLVLPAVRKSSIAQRNQRGSWEANAELFEKVTPLRRGIDALQHVAHHAQRSVHAPPGEVVPDKMVQRVVGLGWRQLQPFRIVSIPKAGVMPERPVQRLHRQSRGFSTSEGRPALGRTAAASKVKTAALVLQRPCWIIWSYKRKSPT